MTENNVLKAQVEESKAEIGLQTLQVHIITIVYFSVPRLKPSSFFKASNKPPKQSRTAKILQEGSFGCIKGKERIEGAVRCFERRAKHDKIVSAL